MTTLELLKSQIEFAPQNPGPIAKNLRGWWTPDGYYVDAVCAGRIMARGHQLPQNSEPVWSDRPGPLGVCCCCDK